MEDSLQYAKELMEQELFLAKVEAQKHCLRQMELLKRRLKVTSENLLKYEVAQVVIQQCTTIEKLHNLHVSLTSEYENHQPFRDHVYNGYPATLGQLAKSRNAERQAADNVSGLPR